MADNELYLTKGEAKAVREGSDTVDMTDNQMKAMGRRGFGGSSSGLTELIMRLLGGEIKNLSGIAELIGQTRDVTRNNKMDQEKKSIVIYYVKEFLIIFTGIAILIFLLWYHKFSFSIKLLSLWIFIFNAVLFSFWLWVSKNKSILGI